MTLQGSGQISISQMRDEYALGNPISMSSFYGKNGLPGSGQIRFSDFYGKSNYLDQQVITVGAYSNSPYYYRGLINGGGQAGSISDGTSNLYGGATIQELYFRAYFQDSNPETILKIVGTHANSGWTTMTINGAVYYRANATFSYTGGMSMWRWPGLTNPFGLTAGVQVTATWL